MVHGPIVHGTSLCFKSIYRVLGPVMASVMFRSSATRILTVACRQVQTSAWRSKPWKVGKLNHIAIACPDLDKATALYRDVMRAKVSEKQAVLTHGVTVVFVELGNTKIELLHPLGDKSPIKSFLEKNKSGGMHHVCLEVNDIKSAIEELKSRNIRTLSEKPTNGAHGKPVVFLHPKDCDGVLVELEEV